MEWSVTRQNTANAGEGMSWDRAEYKHSGLKWRPVPLPFFGFVNVRFAHINVEVAGEHERDLFKHAMSSIGPKIVYAWSHGGSKANQVPVPPIKLAQMLQVEAPKRYAFDSTSNPITTLSQGGPNRDISLFFSLHWLGKRGGYNTVRRGGWECFPLNGPDTIVLRGVDDRGSSNKALTHCAPFSLLMLKGQWLQKKLGKDHVTTIYSDIHHNRQLLFNLINTTH